MYIFSQSIHRKRKNKKMTDVTKIYEGCYKIYLLEDSFFES